MVAGVNCGWSPVQVDVLMAVTMSERDGCPIRLWSHMTSLTRLGSKGGCLTREGEEMDP